MIIAVLLIALILRLVKLNQSLWLDEAINVNVVHSLGFKRLVVDYAIGDFPPPFFHIVLKSWMQVFGSSEIAVRIPSVIFGVATVYLIFLIGRKLYEQKTALIAATLLATSPLHIYYSQEARMYMLAAFFTALSVYFFISIMEKNRI